MNAENDHKTVGDVAGISGMPDAVEAAHIDKKLHDPAFNLAATRARGVEWVRPTDLIARAGANVSGRGIDFQREMARRIRSAASERTQHLGDRARRLPPLSAFGRRSAERGTERSAVGMR